MFLFEWMFSVSFCETEEYIVNFPDNWYLDSR